MDTKKKLVDIYKVKDDSDSWLINPKLPVWSDTQSLRLIICGKTGCGKTNLLCNLLLNIYLGVWKPENIYIWSYSLKGDFKLKLIIEYLKIPEENLFETYNEEEVMTVFDFVRDEFMKKVENKEKPEPSLFLFDDISFSGALAKRKSGGAIPLLMMNGRKYLMSIIQTSQRISDISTSSRSQANGAVFYRATNREIDLISNDFDYTESGNKKHFKEMFKHATGQSKNDFLSVDLTKNNQKMYSKSFEEYLY